MARYKDDLGVPITNQANTCDLSQTAHAMTPLEEVQAQVERLQQNIEKLNYENQELRNELLSIYRRVHY